MLDPQDSHTKLQRIFPCSPSVNFHPRLSADPEAAISDLPGAGVTISDRVEAAPLEWTPVNSLLRFVQNKQSSPLIDANCLSSQRTRLQIAANFLPKAVFPESLLFVRGQA